MSRNLGTSKCVKCGYPIELKDIRGKPLEIRRYGPYRPDFGVRFDCSCGEIYFVIIRLYDEFWSDQSISDKSYLLDERPIPGTNKTVRNEEKGRFVHRQQYKDTEYTLQTGCFVLDLSYYGSFDDEKPQDWSPADKPWHLCEDNASDVQWTW